MHWIAWTLVQKTERHECSPRVFALKSAAFSAKNRKEKQVTVRSPYIPDPPYAKNSALPLNSSALSFPYDYAFYAAMAPPGRIPINKFFRFS